MIDSLLSGKCSPITDPESHGTGVPEASPYCDVTVEAQVPALGRHGADGEFCMRTQEVRRSGHFSKGDSDTSLAEFPM